MDFIDPLYYQILSVRREWAVAAAVLGIAAAVALVMLVKRHCLRGGQALALELLGVYLFLVFSSTVFSRNVADAYQYELLPFWSYLEIYNGNTCLVQENFLNFLMLMPVGLLFPVCVRRNGARRTLLFGLGCTVTIEVLQLLTRRGLFEFDDILHNTLGVAAGYGVYKVCGRWIGKFRQ